MPTGNARSAVRLADCLEHFCTFLFVDNINITGMRNIKNIKPDISLLITESVKILSTGCLMVPARKAHLASLCTNSRQNFLGFVRDLILHQAMCFQR